MLEVSMVQSMAGLIEGGCLSRTRPFRAPHHSASMAAMVGGGMRVKPGEASLAHHGILFLDELPEFSSQVLDSLRQPLETGDIIIARANAHVRFPAAFQLVCALNPCKCGYGKASGRNCGRGPNCEILYQSRVSGPFMDRMDLAIDTPPVSAMDLSAPATGETTAIVAARVHTAREAQTSRARELIKAAGDSLPSSKFARPLTNARLSDKLLAQVATPDAEGAALLTRATASLSLSARAYTRSLRVARTLADLDGVDTIARRHIAEAISYRRHEDLHQPAASLNKATFG